LSAYAGPIPRFVVPLLPDEPSAPPEAEDGDWDAGLTPEERAVLEPLMGGECLMVDKIAVASGLPVSGVSATLLMLELKKRIIKHADGRFEAR